MKRRISLLLAVVMILGSFSFVFAAEETAEEAAGAFLKEVGVLEGINGDLKLEDNLRRQDMVVLVARLHGAEEEAEKFPTEDLTFTDFKDPYYRPIIAWAVANNLIEGHTAERFGFNEDVTAQQYATVLLRALGYNDKVADVEGYAKALEEAKKLGILEGVKVENSTAVTRGQMSLMTYNALGVTMKDSDETLAEKLGIKMPEPDELKVEEVYTENLKEVVVELSNAKLADKEKLADANNYKLTGNVIEKATLEGNNVTLLLKEALVKGREYELVIRGIDKAINNKFKFKANDNTIPKVEEVVVLGEYGIKVITSEPVANVKERNFLVDGKNIAMEVEQYGRAIILTPYHKASFPENAKALTVKGLEDYAGYKSVEEEFEIEVKKDAEAPKVVDVIGRGNKVEVVFDKDIYNNSIDAYYSRVYVGNISYESGRHSIYAEDAEKVDTNRVVYTFKDELPRRTVVTIVDVENHSQVAMEKTTMEVREVLDNVEPEIIDKKVYTDPKGTATIKLYFNKDVKGSFEGNSKTKFVAKDHFTLYEREVLNRNILEHKIDSVEYEKDREDVIVVELSGLKVNNKDKDYNYILEVVGFVDASSLRNKMYRDYVDFDIKPATTAFKVVDVYVSAQTKARTEITIEFNKAVDRTLAEDPTNYIFKHTNGARYDVKDLGGDIVTERNGKDVTLILPEFNPDRYEELRILDTLKDKDGSRLNKETSYKFGANYSVLVERAEKAEKDAKELLDISNNETANEKALQAAYDKLVKLDYSDVKTHDELVEAIEEVEKYIGKVEDEREEAAADKEKADKEKVVKVEKLIEALPAEKDLKLADKEKVVKARTELTALGEELGASVSKELVTKLERAEAKIAELEEARNTALTEELAKYEGTALSVDVAIGDEISLLKEDAEVNEDIKVSYIIVKGADYLEIKDGKLVVKAEIDENFAADIKVVLELDGKTVESDVLKVTAE
ncbi:PspA/IM30 family protein [Clostridium sp. Cult3]|uniref:PspA/IM30 family protein n=1 Tax=Clostridium sp. Cult3 TaxID=2079004 RepID=UPI001F3121B0|nr:hypothetical protein [Clostridium sp. Cult3]MCF6459519.1 hypothetical protein [Clostridium sp. Cult3]